VATALDQPKSLARARADFETGMRKGPREYSWFIYRATNPTIRDMFMHPNNFARVKEALMSLLAGDIYGQTPMWWGLRRFKILYYLIAVFHPMRTWRGWRKHRNSIKDMGKLQGESIMS